MLSVPTLIGNKISMLCTNLNRKQNLNVVGRKMCIHTTKQLRLGVLLQCISVFLRQNDPTIADMIGPGCKTSEAMYFLRMVQACDLI